MNAPVPPPPTSHRELLNRWEYHADIARALEDCGLKISSMGVSRWVQNDSIPGPYWHPVATLADEAQHMGFTACLKMLAAHAYERERQNRVAGGASPDDGPEADAGASGQ